MFTVCFEGFRMCFEGLGFVLGFKVSFQGLGYVFNIQKFSFSVQFLGFMVFLGLGFFRVWCFLGFSVFKGLVFFSV